MLCDPGMFRIICVHGNPWQEHRDWNVTVGAEYVFCTRSKGSLVQALDLRVDPIKVAEFECVRDCLGFISVALSQDERYSPSRHGPPCLWSIDADQPLPPPFAG